MKKFFSSLSAFALLLFLSNSLVLAQGAGGGSAGIQPFSPIGTLDPPASIIKNVGQVGTLFTNVVRLIVVIAGIWAFFQFLLGGFAYISGAGDAKKVAEANQKFMHAILGLVIIVASFILAGLIGLIFFGNAFFILRPQIETIN